MPIDTEFNDDLCMHVITWCRLQPQDVADPSGHVTQLTISLRFSPYGGVCTVARADFFELTLQIKTSSQVIFLTPNQRNYI